MTVVITHKEDGIYLGNCMGLGFWSLMDTAGQPCAATFEDEGQARRHVEQWDNGSDPDRYSYVIVATKERYATVDDLIAAGLEAMISDMRKNEAECRATSFV